MRAPLCPAKPAKDGPLTDQGEQVGQIGRSSNSYIGDDPAVRYCVAVLAANRTGRAVIVVVKVVNHGTTPVKLDSDDQIVVTVTAGGEVTDEDFTVDVNALAGALPPGQSLTGRYAFTVPASTKQVTVTAGPATSQDQGVWVGLVT